MRNDIETATDPAGTYAQLRSEVEQLRKKVDADMKYLLLFPVTKIAERAHAKKLPDPGEPKVRIAGR